MQQSGANGYLISKGTGKAKLVVDRGAGDFGTIQNRFSNWAQMVDNSGEYNIEMETDDGDNFNYTFRLSNPMKPQHQQKPDSPHQVREAVIREVAEEYEQKSINQQILERLESIEDRLDEDDLEHLEEGETDILGGLTPLLLSILKNGNQGLSGAAVAEPGAAIGSLNHSISILRQNDSDFEKHLAKLAKISNEQPDTFAQLIGSLDLLA